MAAHCWLCDAEAQWLASGRPLARREGRPTPFVCRACAERATTGPDAVSRCTFCGSSDQQGVAAANASVCAACATTALTAAQ